ncbi:MAG: hypothetical protein V2I33_04990 [Kangiellaceae bacterium]|jgi:photoactive yellow protein|nr:hypothetical protein [Kangiellaceae bacterium]
MSFESITIGDLNSQNTSALNAHNYGVVKMDHSGTVTDYNNSQSEHTGMSKDAVMGKHFFTQVAPCTNNFMVSQKYDSAEGLDETVPYTFTIKMAPTPLTLRLLKDSSSQYLLCKWN